MWRNTPAEQGAITTLSKSACAILNNKKGNTTPIKVSDAVKSILKKVGKQVEDEVNVYGDQFGFANLSPFSVLDVDIDDMQGNYLSDYSDAISKLKNDYNANDISDLETKMSQKLGHTVKISNGKTIIINGETMTWHHHQNCKTMQLVPFEIHDPTYHIGGKNILDNYTDKDEAKKLMPFSPEEITKHFLCPKNKK